MSRTNTSTSCEDLRRDDTAVTLHEDRITAQQVCLVFHRCLGLTSEYSGVPHHVSSMCQCTPEGQRVFSRAVKTEWTAKTEVRTSMCGFIRSSGVELALVLASKPSRRFARLPLSPPATSFDYVCIVTLGFEAVRTTSSVVITW